MDQLRLQGMEAVDTVLALLRGINDMDVLGDVAEVLELDLDEDVLQDRRRLLRAISNNIESEEFDDLDHEEAARRIDNIHLQLHNHYRNLLPVDEDPVADAGDAHPVPDVEGLQIDVVGNEDAELLGDPPVLPLPPHIVQQLLNQQQAQQFGLDQQNGHVEQAQQHGQQQHQVPQLVLGQQPNQDQQQVQNQIQQQQQQQQQQLQPPLAQGNVPVVPNVLAPVPGIPNVRAPVPVAPNAQAPAPVAPNAGAPAPGGPNVRVQAPALVGPNIRMQAPAPVGRV